MVSCGVSDVMMIVVETVVETSIVVSVYEMVPVLLVMFRSQDQQRGCGNLVVYVVMSGVSLVDEPDES